MSRHVHLAVFFLCLTLALSLVQSNVFTRQQRYEMVRFVNSLMECRGITGLSMAVVHGNEKFTRAFGKAGISRSAHRLLKFNKLGIASITNSFTSALISILLERTGYTWQSTVKEIMGEDFEFATEDLTREVTVADVLSHQTGLNTHNILWATKTYIPRDDYVRQIRFLPKTHDRGEHHYNNNAYALAGSIAEKLAGDGRRWEELLRDYILDPLGMDDTGALGLDLSVWDNKLVMGILRRENTLVEMEPEVYRIEPYHATASLASTPGDMAKWMKLIINRGRTEQGQQLLSQASLNEMTRVHVTKSIHLLTTPVTYSIEGFGLGWYTGHYRGERVILHDGDIFGLCSFQWIIPSHNIGVFTVNSGPCNSIGLWVNILISMHVSDIFMGHEPWLNSRNGCQFFESWVDDSPKPPMICNTRFNTKSWYTGAYCHPFFGEFHITQIGSQGLHIDYDALQADLCRTLDANLIEFQVRETIGSYYYESQGFPGNVLQLNFSDFAGGWYGRVELNDPVLGNGPLSFERCG